MTEQNETGAMHQQHGRINREGKFTPVSDVKPIKIAVQDDDMMPVSQFINRGTRYRFDEFINHCLELPDDELMKVFDYTYENHQPHVHFPVSI